MKTIYKTLLIVVIAAFSNNAFAQISSKVSAPVEASETDSLLLVNSAGSVRHLSFSRLMQRASEYLKVPSGIDGQIQFNNSGELGGASNLYWDKTSNKLGIGIGMSQPLYELHVYGDIGFRNNEFISNHIDKKLIFYNGDGSFTSGYFRSLAIGGAYEPTIPDHSLYVQGKIGVGTVTPGQELHVIGSALFEEGALLAKHSTTSNANFLDIRASEGEGRMRLSNGTNWGLFLKGESNHPKIGTTGVGSLTFRGFGLSSMSNDPTDKDLMVIDFRNDKVNIGGFSSSAKLGIAYESNNVGTTLGSSDSALDLYNSLEQDVVEKGAVLTFSDKFYSSNTGFHKTTRAAIKGGTDTTGNTANGFLAFYTDSAGGNSPDERMRIDKDGKVGIGTTNPLEALHVEGKAYIRRTGTATAHSDTDLLISDSTSPNSTGQVQILGGNNAFSHLYFSDTDNHAVGGIKYSHINNTMALITNNNHNGGLFIDDSQNVGVNTSSPGSALEVLSKQLDTANSEAVIIDTDINLTPANTPRFMTFKSGGDYVGSIHETTSEGTVAFDGVNGVFLKRNKVFYIGTGSTGVLTYKPLLAANSNGLELRTNNAERSVRIQGVSGQTADILTVEDSAGDVKVKVDSRGDLTANKAFTPIVREVAGGRAFIYNPKGGFFAQATAIATGYYIIKTPLLVGNDYASIGVTFEIGSQYHSPVEFKLSSQWLTNSWEQLEVYSTSKETVNYPVKLGNDGVNTYIIIGTDTTVWNRTSLVVKEVTTNYAYNDVDVFSKDWDVSINNDISSITIDKTQEMVDYSGLVTGITQLLKQNVTKSSWNTIAEFSALNIEDNPYGEFYINRVNTCAMSFSFSSNFNGTDTKHLTLNWVNQYDNSFYQGVRITDDYKIQVKIGSHSNAGNGHNIRVFNSQGIKLVTPTAATGNETILKEIDFTGGSRYMSKISTAPEKLAKYTVALLPTIAREGDIAYVTDASNPGYRAIVTGGGTEKVMVFFNGTNWICH